MAHHKQSQETTKFALPTTNEYANTLPQNATALPQKLIIKHRHTRRVHKTI